MDAYVVNVREVHVQPYVIRANSLKEAIAKVAAGGGDIIEGGFVYSHSQDPETWDGHLADEEEQGFLEED